MSINFWGLVDGATSFFRKPKSQTFSPTSTRNTSSPIIDWTEDISCNYALTSGLYHNTYPGMKLAGFGFNAINVPISFMGYPVVKSDNDLAQEQIDLMLEAFTSQMKDIHTQCHREGTIWIYPRYSYAKGLYWEFIRDDTVSKLVKDINTGELIRLETEEQQILSRSDSDSPLSVTKKRVFTKTRITTVFTGDIQETKITRNPVGALPIGFKNNAESSEYRGFSDYERIVSDLKNYHDTDLAESTTLNKFSSKLVQKVLDFNNWKKNNGYSSSTSDTGQNVAAIDIAAIDLIFNMDGEDTTMLEPNKDTGSYQTKLKQIFRKIVELSGIPEIAWGLKTEGNLASVEENMAILMRYVDDKQQQKVESYTFLFEASLRLLQASTVISDTGNVSVGWNNLESLTAKTKAEIFKSITESLSTIVNKALWSKEMMYEYMLENFPQITPDTFEKYEEGITSMTGHNARAGAGLIEQLESQGATF